MSESKLVVIRMSDVKADYFPTPRGPAVPPTIEELVALEPRLSDLLAEAEHYQETDAPLFCANAVIYGYPGYGPSLKQRLSKLVGWTSGQEGLLRTSAAYDVAYKAVWNALPDCTPDCLCQRMNGRV